LFAANGKRKRHTSICLLQTEKNRRAYLCSNEFLQKARINNNVKNKENLIETPYLLLHK
jgi:hypothetical protein